ncbi:protein kinase family protein [Kineococcus sp. SYSU DK003]|uniref:protein kinase family protein n=1 Tax=Kineococcus sp. SYSU DK003 TaxID=3383124 RepID=UPI003D7D7360
MTGTSRWSAALGGGLFLVTTGPRAGIDYEHWGVALDGAGRSTGEELVADRYVLDRELSVAAELGTRDYLGRDLTLDRPVRVRTLDAGDARAEEFLDSARRAAMLSDPRIPRILDAGTDPDTATVYVVEEAVVGRSMTDLLRTGPLGPAAVRALVGEVATALDSAARRGLHHTRLTPDDVFLGPDGIVRVRGVGVEAALDPDPPAVSAARAAALANRADAVGLVALVYAGLVARWPELDGLTAHGSLPEAPTADGRPLPPKDIRPDVPNDLDTLCAVTFGPHEDGPRDPAELALQLAPWSMAPWDDVLRRMRGEAAAAEVRGRLKNREEVVPEEEPPVPFTRPHSTARPARDDSRFVLTLVGAVVVVGLVLALWQLSQIGGSRSTAEPTPSATVTSTAAAPSPTATATATATPTQSASATPVLVPVAAISALDPQGDGESSETAPRALDGDPATVWESQRYNSAAFGGLKDGIGLLLDLGVEVDVTRVDLADGGEGGAVSLLTAPGPSLDGSAPVATAAAGGQQALVPAQPVRARYLVVWFTELPRTEGVFRASVAEIAVTGVPVP